MGGVAAVQSFVDSELWPNESPDEELPGKFLGIV